MMRGIPERDWKYLGSVKSDMLEALCARVNDEARRIARDQASGHHERFLRLYAHLVKGNEMVADCFDDWHMKLKAKVGSGFSARRPAHRPSRSSAPRSAGPRSASRCWPGPGS